MRVKLQAWAYLQDHNVLLHLLVFFINFITVALLFDRAKVSKGSVQNACYAVGIADLVAVSLQLQWSIRTIYSASRPADQGGLEW